jgi:hypothetical protein
MKAQKHPFSIAIPRHSYACPFRVVHLSQRSTAIISESSCLVLALGFLHFCCHFPFSPVVPFLLLSFLFSSRFFFLSPFSQFFTWPFPFSLPVLLFPSLLLLFFLSLPYSCTCCLPAASQSHQDLKDVSGWP